MVLVPILMIFGALETGLKFDDFRWLSRGPGVEGPLPDRGNWPVRGSIPTANQSAGVHNRYRAEGPLPDRGNWLVRGPHSNSQTVCRSSRKMQNALVKMQE